VGLLEYTCVTRWMNGLGDPHNLSVKAVEQLGHDTNRKPHHFPVHVAGFAILPARHQPLGVVNHYLPVRRDAFVRRKRVREGSARLTREP